MVDPTPPGGHNRRVHSSCNLFLKCCQVPICVTRFGSVRPRVQISAPRHLYADSQSEGVFFYRSMFPHWEDAANLGIPTQCSNHVKEACLSKPLLLSLGHVSALRGKDSGGGGTALNRLALRRGARRVGGRRISLFPNNRIGDPVARSVNDENHRYWALFCLDDHYFLRCCIISCAIRMTATTTKNTMRAGNKPGCISMTILLSKILIALQCLSGKCLSKLWSVHLSTIYFNFTTVACFQSYPLVCLL